MKLSELKNNESGIIVKVQGRGAFRKRITEMGFVKGKKVTVIKNAPLRDPVEYQIMNYQISLRRSEAALIDIITLQEAKNDYITNFEGVTTEDILKTTAQKKGKTINIALVGNPNCGKTTIFNKASNSYEHVGNYGGVTVDLKKAVFKQNDYTFNLYDLPGTYSLTAYSPEELYVREYIHNQMPDIVINVIDASNLERNLYLTTQLIDMDVKVITALNMYDELQTRGDEFDYKSLGQMIGIPFVPTIGSKGKGIKELFDKAIEVYEDRESIMRHIHINYGKDTEKAIFKIQEKIKKNYSLTDKISSRFLAIKLLEDDKQSFNIIKQCKNFKEINETSKKYQKWLINLIHEDIESHITDARYGFIAGALRETYKESTIERRRKIDNIDNFMTHKVFGFPIFIFFMWLMFQTTFSLGQYPMEWIENLVAFTSQIVENQMPDGMLKDLLIDGIIAGVGGVIIFLPNILILFFFIALMEDTGYMARVAFIMDKIMHKIGLHGKSFIPLLMGFGCNVPAIMATRTLENRNDRLLTILINPFMSCSARLPVYILIAGAVFAENAGNVIFLIYFIGIAIAVGIAILFKKTIFKSKEVPFVMELPPYRIPTLKNTLRHMWGKGSEYLKKMGGIIMVASIIIWALGYFPQEVEYSKNYDQLIKKEQENLQKKPNEKKSIEKQIAVLSTQKKAEHQKKSYIGRIGKAIQPVIEPLGFDWKMGIGLITGAAAKEMVISTLAVLYQTDTDNGLTNDNLKERIKHQTYESGKNKGKKIFTPVVAMAFLIFVLIYFPCIAVVAAVKKETGHWKWSLFVVVYTTLLAWVASFLIYQVGSLIY